MPDINRCLEELAGDQRGQCHGSNVLRQYFLMPKSQTCHKACHVTHVCLGRPILKRNTCALALMGALCAFGASNASAASFSWSNFFSNFSWGSNRTTTTAGPPPPRRPRRLRRRLVRGTTTTAKATTTTAKATTTTNAARPPRRWRQAARCLPRKPAACRISRRS